ncbi:hypothetical protein CWI39_0066p0020 [Hamiltosporidium magnivora]|uniref:Uncharacterized protein n=1 Tax=Hamiltosporidium magnivora TaxID=148818 RepID=A0A4Q9LQ58_9MICR|nr:hypothetical protein CWI39_0066p0020 [Hamiltosporidium magnivora]
MYFQKFIPNKNFILIVSLLLTCKSSDNLRSGKRSFSEISKDQTSAVSVKKGSKTSDVKRLPVSPKHRNSSTNKTSSDNVGANINDKRRHTKGDSPKKQGRINSRSARTEKIVNIPLPREDQNFGFTLAESGINHASNNISKVINRTNNVRMYNTSISRPSKPSSVETPGFINVIYAHCVQRRSSNIISSIFEKSGRIYEISENEFLEKYFTILEELAPIEDYIIKFNPQQKKIFEDLFEKNKKHIDLSISEDSVLLEIPIFISINKIIEEVINSGTSNIKNHVTFFFYLKLIEAFIKEIHKRINFIFNRSADIRKKNIHLDKEFNTALYNGLLLIIRTTELRFSIHSPILKKYYKAFLFACEFFRSMTNTNVAYVDAKITQDDFTVFLIDVILYIEESDINEICLLIRREQNTPLDGQKPKFAKITPKCLSNDLIHKIIGYYLIIFEKKYLKNRDKVSSFEFNDEAYANLQKRFDIVSKKNSHPQEKNRTTLIHLLEDTYKYFHDFALPQKISEKNQTEKES